ncbi:tRNA (adenosine(37)-N6)-threonylcarbamoyltransferase complex ATPase subunit type 1 TsaE [Tepidibacillus fermentans]|uniref:tRNA threonylcarbamoyladenosine biosynthesis protein TsaE n=1 Tax=Tepidibacillus fermentans TaxID=1281767 RepID=A0A4R3K979_9BACI|nr:tRNA (adenosine(37)-N6)-threonylcarbamoyltransferase complex ATPase subunit type 1 TsaE [Tepidibacillus fermentans]TCS79576.1 tRNA threonylcarbamoyladenosine biosynthesis protein TsaE [Tepidibacillus fermentans]
MNPYQMITNNINETQEIAKRLAKYLKPGNVITLEGDLGAGKTSFTQGLAKGLEIQQTVNSPTFNIIKEYQGRLPLYHMDVYRLEDEHEDLGFEEYFFGEGVTVVEWAENIREFLPKELLNIKISRLEAENRRLIQFEPIGDQYRELCKEFFQHENIST